MKLLEKIKSFFRRNKELKNYHYGDIIWCYIDKYGDFIFEGNHQIRPFIFLYYKNKTIYGYTMTHSAPSKYKLHYDLDIVTNDQYVILSCLFELPKKSYRGYKDKLSNEDASLIGKIIFNMQDDDVVKEDIRKNIIIKDNDIVIYNNEKYLVYSVNNSDYTLYKITKNKKDIKIHLTEKEVVYLSPKAEIVKKGQVTYFDTFKIYICVIFGKLKKNYNRIHPQGNMLKVGDLVKTTKGVYIVLAINEKNYTVSRYYVDYPTIIYLDKCNKYKVVNHISMASVKKFKEKMEKVKSKINTFSN